MAADLGLTIPRPIGHKFVPMNALQWARLCQRCFVAICCFALLAHCGCASYFRRGELPPDELNQKNQEQQKSERGLFIPEPGAGTR
jgi:hypothetical protein